MKTIFAYIVFSTFALANKPNCMGRELWPSILKKLSSSGFGTCKAEAGSDYEIESYKCDKVHYGIRCTHFGEDIFHIHVVNNDLLKTPGGIPKTFVDEMGKYLMDIVPSHFKVKCEKDDLQNNPDQIRYTCRGSEKIYALSLPRLEGYFSFTFQETK